MIKKTFDVILLLGGSSVRCQTGINKVFVKVKGKEIFKYALDVILKSDCKKIIIVYKEEEKESLLLSMKEYNDTRIEYIKGGKERQDSVFEGMKKVNADYVLVHDGARPNISLDDLNKTFIEATLHDASLVVSRATETIKEYKASKVTTLERRNLWVAKTPQCVNAKMFKESMEKSKEDGFLGTDDVSLLEKYYDLSPKFVEASTNNLKITTLEDLYIFEKLLEKQGTI